jgi:transcriptional regulator with XRE-family HTH domain
MVADSDQSPLPARRLAERLRDFRERKRLTQRQLAAAIGGADALSVATISQWENPGSGRLPPPQRLAMYARLFCTGRSFASGAPRLLGDDELTEQEREREGDLYTELLALREGALPAPDPAPARLFSPFWQFPDGAAVSIVCAEAPDPPSYADEYHLNYTHLAKHADLDALMEVHGQVRADNPDSVVRVVLPEGLGQELSLENLIIIGGAAVKVATEAGADTKEIKATAMTKGEGSLVNDTEMFASDIPLPVARPTGDTHFFECEAVNEKNRSFASIRDADGVLAEDVGLIARCPHPIVRGKTVTVLSGITSRGVHGAALCFINSHNRIENERYLKEKLGNADKFCILMRVKVRNNAALPPNLWDDDVRLYEWSPETGVRW